MTQPNPLLKALGLSADDRVVIFHADDIGMCEASLSAYRDLADFGLLSAASIMTPCSWAPATAEFCRTASAQIDMGVHLTLTSEWSRYRWGPLSTRDAASGLMDEEGYFHATTDAVAVNANPASLQRECQAQVEWAIAAGIDVTHIDSHMGAVIHPAFMTGYLALGEQFNVPTFLPRLNEEQMKALGLATEQIEYFIHHIELLEDRGFPFLDSMSMAPLEDPGFGLPELERELDALPAGITYYIIHPASDTPELQAIASDWQARVAQYQMFTDERLRTYVRDSGLHVIGYRAIRDLMRTRP